MTLPFRRRHHDDESAHDRARAIWSHGMLEPVEPADGAWLDSHLAGCGECRVEREAFLEDRELLRSLRDQPPEPPRDLWARTAAAIEQEATRRSRHGVLPGFPDGFVPRRARLPLGAMAGLLVAIVVLATSLAPRGIPLAPGATGSAVALASTPAGPTPIPVNTATLGWLQGNADGSYQLTLADVDQVCPDLTTGCAPLKNTQTTLKLDAKPQSIVSSPGNHDLVVVGGSTGSDAGTVRVVPVPTGPSPSGAPTATPTLLATASPLQSPVATPRASPTGSPGSTPGATPEPTPAGTPGATPAPTPLGQVSIAEGVTVVGEAAYSPDGSWLAFSARPVDSSTGPDLYLWKVGEVKARPVTSDHATFFSGWFGDRILASRVIRAATGAPAASGEPSAGASSTPASPSAIGSPSVAPTLPAESHPVSFLLDPATMVSQDLATPDVWLPSVDPLGRFATYWLGTVVPDAAGTGWVPGSGRLVLDGWKAPLEPDASAAPSASPIAAGTIAPSASPAGPAIGPAGTPVDLAVGPIGAFDARFDPTGIRLAVWVADSADPTVGTLRLIVLDRGHLRIAQNLKPLPSVTALRGFSMDSGRLAWVSPPGQNGNQSVVQVLAWSADTYGQVETLPAGQPFIVR
jgi:hypothetical protein